MVVFVDVTVVVVAGGSSSDLIIARVCSLVKNVEYILYAVCDSNW